MPNSNLDGILDNTVQSQVSEQNLWLTPDSGIGILPLLTRAGDLLPPYWSRARDLELSRFALKIDHVSSAFSLFISKFSTIPVKIIPRDTSIKAHVKQARDLTANLNEMSNWGMGWTSSFSPQMVLSFLTQDNGMTAEIIGDGPPDKARQGFYGLAFLDPSKIQRTSYPEFPIIYWDIGPGGTGNRYKMHYTRVMTATSMPSTYARLNGMGFCLDRDAIVQMADGSQKRIIDLVRSKSTDLVASLDEDGNLVEKPITNWYVNPVANRKMINIRGDLAKLNQGSKQKNSWITEDHPVLTPSGWVEAGELKTGDSIVSGLPTPNQKQKEFLIGTILGDGSLALKKGNALQYRPRFSMGHAIAQREWFDLKANVLCQDFGFSSRTYDYKIIYLGEEKIFPGLSGQTNAHAGFINLRKAFYPEGKKIIPLDLIKENLSPIMLATWYLDDGNIIDRTREKRIANQEKIGTYRGGGYYAIEITTTGFEPNQVDELAEILNKAGYEAVTINVNRTKKAKSIRFLKDGAMKLFNDIAPYVPNSMRYKLPPNMPKFNPDLWNLGQADRLIDKVEIKTEWHKKIQTVYCIDVADTHNFISAGIVVHNCALSRMVNTAQHLLDLSTTEQEELGSRPKRRLIIGRMGITAQEIANAFMLADRQMDNEGLSRYSKSVVIASTTKPTNNNSIELDVKDLAPALRGEDKERSITLGMFLIALALNIPPRWLWPATSTGATKADAMYQHVAGMGGGVGNLIQTFINMLGGSPMAGVLGKPIPPHLEVSFDFQDDEQDRAQAEIRELRSTVWTNNISNGMIDVHIARQQALEAGDLSEQEYDDLELTDGRLPDGTDVLNLFVSTDPDIQDMLSLSVGDVLNTEANDPAIVLPAIDDQIIVVRAILATPDRPAIFDKAKQAMAALLALKKLYEGAKVEQQTTSEQSPAEQKPIDDSAGQAVKVENTIEKIQQ